MDLRKYVPAIADFPTPGVSFRDITPLLGSAEAFRASIDGMVRLAPKGTYDVIAAFDARGFLWAAPLADREGVPLIPIRKAGKLPGDVAAETYTGEYADVAIEIRTDAITAGTRVLLIDDIIATGESMAAGCRLVEKLGGTVTACVALASIGVLGGIERLEGYTVTTLLGPM